MSTEQSTVEAHGRRAEGRRRRARGEDTLHGHRQPHRAAPTSCRSPTAPCARLDLRQIKVDDEDFGLMAYDPAFMNTASCRSAITYIDGDAGHPPAPRLPDRAAVRALHLPRGRLPADQRRAARRATQLDGAGSHEITIHTFVHENVKDFMQGFRYDANPMGMLVASVGALSTFYPDANQIHDERRPRDPDHPAAREDADAGRVRLPPQHGPALRLPRQRPRLRRQLPRDDVQDDRAQIRARSAPGARAGRAVHPARRPRTERLHERRALASARPRSTPTRRSPPASPRSTGRCTAAPTRPRCGCCSGSAASRTSPPSSRA